MRGYTQSFLENQGQSWPKKVSHDVGEVMKVENFWKNCQILTMTKIRSNENADVHFILFYFGLIIKCLSLRSCLCRYTKS